MGQRRKESEWPRQRTRHVWVQTADHHQPPAPGLLITWKRQRGAWWAWVITVVDQSDRAESVVMHWYHQRDITPAPTKPRSPDPHRWHLGLYADEALSNRKT